MSVTLQIKLNGGAPQTGGVTGAIGDVVQLTAANKSTWSGAARWEIYDYPPSFTVPSGWTADGDGVFYALGNSDPASFTISDAADWGKYGFRVTATDGGILTTDDATALSIPSAGGLKSIMAGESSQFGGTREAWVKDLKADIRALAAGSGAGVVAPTPSTTPQRDAAGELYATSFQSGATGSTTVAAVGATSDITLDAGRDVIVDVGAEGDEVAVKANGATAMTVTPTVGNVGIAAARSINVSTSGTSNIALTSARDVEIDHAAGRSTVISEDGTDVASFTAAAIVHTVGAVAETCTDSGGTMLCSVDAPLDIRSTGAMTVQPAQHTSTTGYEAKLQGGQGAASNAGGDCVLQMGEPGSGSTTHGDVSFRTGTGVEVLRVARYSGGNSPEIACTGTMNIVATNILYTPAGGVNLLNSNVANTMRCSASIANRVESGATRLSDQFGHVTALAASGAQNIATYLTTADRVYEVEALAVWSNDTDNTGGSARVEATFRNVAGTVTQIGATFVDADRFRSDDTGIAAASAFTCDNSTATLRVRVNPADADSRNINVTLFVRERVLA